MDRPAPPVATREAAGTCALVAGLAIAVITVMSGSATVKPYVLASLLVMIGVGLRIEAAILASRR